MIKDKRHEFFICYTKALEDFVEKLETTTTRNEVVANSTLENNESSSVNGLVEVRADDLDTDDNNDDVNRSLVSSLSNFQKKIAASVAALDQKTNKPTDSDAVDQQQHTIQGKPYTLDEMKTLAKSENSDDLARTLVERETYSKNLFDILDSQECKVNRCCLVRQIFFVNAPITKTVFIIIITIKGFFSLDLYRICSERTSQEICQSRCQNTQSHAVLLSRAAGF